MANGLAAFVAGMGTGYLRAKEKTLEQERQAKMDQIALDRAQRDQEQYDQEKSLREQLGTAAQQTTVSQQDSALTDTTTGKTAEYQDPNLLASDMREIRRADAATGGNSAQQLIPGAPKYLAAGGVFDSKDAADAAAKTYNSPDAVVSRQAHALRTAGKVNEAMQLESSAKQAKLADFQLDDAKTAHIDKEANRHMDEVFSKAGDWKNGMAQILTETNVGGLDGVEVKPFLSRDSKTVEFKAYMPDGTEKSLGSFENNANGQLAARQQVMKADPITKLQWIKEQADNQHKLSREAIADSQWQKTFDLNAAHQKVMEGLQSGQLSIAKAHLQIAKNTDARAQALHDEQLKLPEAVKQSLASTSKLIDIKEKAMADAMAKGEWDSTKPGAQEFQKSINMLHAEYQNTIAPYLKKAPTGDVAERGAGPTAAAAPNAATGTGKTNISTAPAGSVTLSPDGKTYVASNGVQAPAKQATAAQSGTALQVVSRAGYTDPVIGQKEGQYNVQLPDGTTKVVTASELEKLGFPVESIGGVKQYSPNYNK